TGVQTCALPISIQKIDLFHWSNSGASAEPKFINILLYLHLSVSQFIEKSFHPLLTNFSSDLLKARDARCPKSFLKAHISLPNVHISSLSIPWEYGFWIGDHIGF